ncbi:hypothetical protein BTS2_3304 [Bacillus sp. TS-2]|nr:hypothetical protein BTS2_3304 [Bacillus sp. TS-2]
MSSFVALAFLLIILFAVLVSYFLWYKKNNITNNDYKKALKVVGHGTYFTLKKKRGKLVIATLKKQIE